MYHRSVNVARQLTCMKLGTRELYQPIQACHVVCLGISNKSVAVPRQDSMSPAHTVHNSVLYLTRTLVIVLRMLALSLSLGRPT